MLPGAWSLKPMLSTSIVRMHSQSDHTAMRTLSSHFGGIETQLLILVR